MVTDFAEKNKIVAFSERLRKRAREIDSWLCVGIDPDTSRFPAGIGRDAEGMVEFCRRIVEATHSYAAAFKIQFAFFEMLGPSGWSALGKVRASIPPDIPVIADAKRGDIANTARAYVHAIFDELRFDAVTVNPYLGLDGIAPFLEKSGRMAFVLCRTSNPGADDFQELEIDGEKLYMRVARKAVTLSGGESATSRKGELGLVVGATAPEALRAVRGLREDIVLLVPGVGAQGARAEETVQLAANGRGENALINVSREILFASPGPDFAEAAAASSRSIVEQMRLGTHGGL